MTCATHATRMSYMSQNFVCIVYQSVLNFRFGCSYKLVQQLCVLQMEVLRNRRLGRPAGQRSVTATAICHPCDRQTYLLDVCHLGDKCGYTTGVYHVY